MTDNAKHHVLPLSIYLSVATALLVLTAITVWVAQYDLGEVNLIVAMAIAATKGTLVALFFMHLKYDNKLYAVIFGGALFFLAIFIVITMFDTLRRNDIYNVQSTPALKEAVYFKEKAEAAGTDSTFVDSSTITDTVLDNSAAETTH